MGPFAHFMQWRASETRRKQGGNKWKSEDVLGRLLVHVTWKKLETRWKQGGNKQKVWMYGAICDF